MRKQNMNNEKCKICKANFDVGARLCPCPSRQNTQKGITLIALIITIIILLILAIVSIRLVINGGILDKSKNAVDKYSEAEIQEKIQLAYTDYQMGKLGNENYTFEDALKSAKIAYKSVTGNDEEGYVLTVETKDGDKQYTVSSTGVGKVKALEDYGLKIGDYVAYNEAGFGDYTTDISKGAGGSATYNSTEQRTELTAKIYTTEDLNWRVLGVNEKGGLELISDNSTIDELCLAGKEGYLNGEDVLNEFCNTLYGKGTDENGKVVATGARSLNLEDVKKVTGFTSDEDLKSITSDYGKLYQFRFVQGGNYVEYISSSDGETWTDWTSTGDEVMVFPDIDLILSAESLGTSPIVRNGDVSVYMMCDRSMNSSVKEIIIVDNQDWLASKIYSIGNSIPYTMYEYICSHSRSNPLFCSDRTDSYSYYKAHVRPVVTISSGVQIDTTSTDGKSAETAYVIK